MRGATRRPIASLFHRFGQSQASEQANFRSPPPIHPPQLLMPCNLCRRAINEHFFQRLVRNIRTEDFCTAGGEDNETAGDREDKKPGDEKRKRFRNDIEKLRQLKQEMEEMEKKFDSYFTSEYASKLTATGFEDSDDDFVDSSESERSDLEIVCPSEDELFSDDNDNDEEEGGVDDEDDAEEDDKDDDDEDDNEEDFDEDEDYDYR